MRATHLKFIRRWWLTLILAGLVAGASGFLIAQQLPATYQAEARILVGPVSADRDVLAASSSLVRTFAELAASQPVEQAALEAVGSSRPVTDFAEDVQVQADAEARILAIQVRDPSPDVAANLANAMASALQNVDTTVPRLPEGRLTVVQSATAPVERFGPSAAQVAVLAAIAGFIAAVLLVIAVDYLSDYVSGPDDLPAGIKLLGVVPNRRRALRASRLPVRDAPHSNAALLYQLLAGRLARERPDGVPVLVVAGIGRGEAAGEVAANLALALRGNGMRIRLLDVDGDRHVADSTIGGNPHAGRDDMVQYDLSRKSMRRSVRRGALKTSGSGLSAQTTEMTFARARTDTDLVLVAPQALSTSPSGWMWSQFTDGVVLVIQAEQTGRRGLEQALVTSARVGATILGVVLREHVSPGRGDGRVDRLAQPVGEVREARPSATDRSPRPTE